MLSDTALDVCCGGAGSAFAVLFTNPLDVMRTRMQMQGDLCKKGSYEVHYRNVFQGIYRVSTEEGLAALQKGLRPSILWQFSQNGLRIGLYPMFKKGFQDVFDAGRRLCAATSREASTATRTTRGGGNENMLVCLCAGASSGAVGSFCASPFILVKTRLQSQRSPMEEKMLREFKQQNPAASVRTTGTQYHYNGIYDAFHSIYKAGGLRALWHGSRTAVKRTMVGSSTQLVSYDYVSRWLVSYGNARYPRQPTAEGMASVSWTAKDPRIHFTAALISSGFVVIFMNPFEVVMTRTYNHRATDTEYKGSLRASLAKVYRTEGIAGCYKGAGPMFARFAPHTVLTFLMYEYLKGKCGLTAPTPPPPQPASADKR